MSVGKRRIFRFAIIILAIPVVLLLVLHFFGRNELKVDLDESINCQLAAEPLVIISHPLESKEFKNQINRVVKYLDRRSVDLDTIQDACLGDSTALHLLDRNNRLRGSYGVNQKDVNRLFIELDIIRTKDAYGREVSR